MSWIDDETICQLFAEGLSAEEAQELFEEIQKSFENGVDK